MQSWTVHLVHNCRRARLLPFYIGRQSTNLKSFLHFHGWLNHQCTTTVSKRTRASAWAKHFLLPLSTIGWRGCFISFPAGDRQPRRISQASPLDNIVDIPVPQSRHVFVCRTIPWGWQFECVRCVSCWGLLLSVKSKTLLHYSIRGSERERISFYSPEWCDRMGKSDSIRLRGYCSVDRGESSAFKGVTRVEEIYTIWCIVAVMYAVRGRGRNSARTSYAVTAYSLLVEMRNYDEHLQWKTYLLPRCRIDIRVMGTLEERVMYDDQSCTDGWGEFYVCRPKLIRGRESFVWRPKLHRR